MPMRILFLDMRLCYWLEVCRMVSAQDSAGNIALDRLQRQAPP